MDVKQGKSRRPCRALVSAVLAVSVVGLAAAGMRAWAQDERPGTRSNRDPQAELVDKISAPFTVAAVGDIIEPQPVYSTDPRFQELMDHMRKADVGFANMESSLVDFRHFTGGVAGTEAPLEMGAAMKAMGITLVNRANNHTFDGGVEGMLSTDEELDKLGIVHAGTGRDLQEARAAAYLATPKGRVALVGVFADTVGGSGTNYGLAAATYRNGDIGGTPGMDVLHVTPQHIVTPEQFDQLKSIAAAVPGRASAAEGDAAGAKGEAAAAKGPERLRFFDQWFEPGPNPGGLSYRMNATDEKDILASIRNGKTAADFLIATVHAHQTTSSATQGGIDHTPPDFLVKLAHDAVDNGADMFIAHGVHALHGVEIYKGKPVFYGLSNFVLQFGLQFGTSSDIFANEKYMSNLENPETEESVLTTSHFEGGKLKEVRLYPVDLGGAHRPISQIGIPMLAGPQDAERILKEMQEYSKPFGTNISIENNVGVIRVNEQGQSVAAK